MCPECYSEHKRITPLHNSFTCLKAHTQYICGTCGRCICIEQDPKRKLQRWNYPFSSSAAAKLYLRTADYTNKTACGIYELRDKNGRLSYKIFANDNDFKSYLQKNKNKICTQEQPVCKTSKYKDYPNTQVRKLSEEEIQQYLKEQ